MNINKQYKITGLTVLFITVVAGFIYSGYSMSGQMDNKPAAQTVDITVYRDPNCGCCHKWIRHLEDNGFVVNDIQTGQLQLIKSRYNVSPTLASCHTAVIDDYVIEGHVPAGDIKRLLLERPDVAGLSVPQMPVGTPGMEMGNRKDPFTVISFQENGGTEIFREYLNYSPEDFR